MSLTNTKIADLDKETRDGLYVYLISKIHSPDTIRKEKQRDKLIDSNVYMDIINELLHPLIASEVELVYSKPENKKVKKLKAKKVKFEN